MRTVLLIDADEVSRENLTQVLEADGWRVLAEASGEQGLATALAEQPELVICDLLLPRFTGYQFCRALRQAHPLREVRVILVSSRDFPSDRQGAMEAGADAFLPKPLAPFDLRAAITRLFRQETVATGETGTTAPVPASATRLKFWGVRGSIPTPGPETARYGGNTSCVEVRSAGEIIILDAGSGIRPLGRRLEQEFHEQVLHLTILISHTHWDHIQGFPFFAPAYHARSLVHVLGYEGAQQGLKETLEGQMESSYFPIALKQMPGNIQVEELRDLNFAVGPLRVQAAYVNHPGVCVGYRLFAQEGSITYIPDVEPFQRLKSYPQAEGGGASPESLVYARHQDRRLVEFIAGSEVLIMDSQYDVEEYSDHVGWGDTCVDDTVRLALEAGVKQLFLFHHDPEHDDDKLDALLEHARQLAAAGGGALRVESACEGREFVLASDPAARPPS